MSDSLSWLFTNRSLQKSNCEWIFRNSLKKSDVSDPLIIGENRSQKRAMTPIGLCSCALFLKAMGVINSRRSLHKSEREQFAPITLYKRATMSDSFFFKNKLLFRTFAHKKRAIPSKKPKSKFPTLHILNFLRQNILRKKEVPRRKQHPYT